MEYIETPFDSSEEREFHNKLHQARMPFNEYSFFNLGELLGYRQKVAEELLKNRTKEGFELYSYVNIKIKQLLSL
jgi:hypothetical protein